MPEIGETNDNSSTTISKTDLLTSKLISNVFEGDGFSGWKRGMEIALSAKNKLGFVDGTIPKPTSPDYAIKTWQQCNDIVFTWILNSLSPDIANSVLYSTSAKIAWDELETRYGQTNGAQLYGIHKKLTGFSQGDDSIASYFTKIKLVWDEVDAMGLNPACSCACTCGAAEKRYKFQQNQRVVQLLMGLNESYKVIRGTLLMHNPLPSIASVYSVLLQEEKQREFSQDTQIHHESTSFYAKNFKGKGTNPSYNPYNQFVNQSKPYNQPQSNQFFNQTRTTYNKLDSKDTDNQTQTQIEMKTCRYCKNPGHLISNCKRLEYNNNKRRFANNVQEFMGLEFMGQPYNNTGHFSGYQQGLALNSGASSSGSYSNSVASGSAGQDISPGMYDQLQNALHVSQPTDNSNIGFANFAGLFYEDANDTW